VIPLETVTALHGTSKVGPSIPSAEATQKSLPTQGGVSFAETLKGYLSEIRNLEEEAGRQVNALAEGKTTEVHQVMLAVEEANLALDLLIEIRNRLLETYHQLSRTSI